ncbi:hypothetical protein BSL78_26138 [Apostichopus japonicus]|uniref:Uncharacterized protein n=1 Tax=Stichopus japonicus TaxID=307972 RepID=A0A2G8JMP0_STIJA|nr:hypothetical protein BSL78_26138 [Apostichopus japonicus]
MVEATVIFRVLYSFIRVGVSLDGEKVPPEQLAAFQQQMNQSDDTTGYPNLPSIMEGDENESEDYPRTPAGFSDMLEDDEDSDSVMEVDADGDGFNSAPNSQSNLTGEEETSDDVNGMDEDEDLASAGEEDDQEMVTWFTKKKYERSDVRWTVNSSPLERNHEDAPG